ncbi:uncharacterized protein LOC108632323 isoform X2 [Ceratina calcarata]|uniref:Uncharacterized protein LOC108632323 isoform X2 n=1 Tax=Ceratina calcarata TaxID=156304 RepID=A0AAJ7JGS7_9HYME|nr:uncharacterized protein LOC108632323 isoform X2 [Ceratina calcarata]
MKSNESTESNTIDMTPPPSKKVARAKRFCDSWLGEPDFSSWLQKCEGSPFKAFCTLCQRELQCGKSELRRHASTQSHITMVCNREGLTDTDSAEWVASASLSERVKRAEIIYVLNMVEHSRSFHSYEQHRRVQLRAVDSMDVLKKMKLKSAKIAAITKNVINEAIVRNVTEILRNISFSILVDVTTDVSGYKNLCILARYNYDGANHTYLLDYLHLREGNAEHLYDCFKYSMEKYNIPVKNVIGISVDNATVMMGKHDSFVSRLMAENDSEVVVLPCICHSIHLATCNACEKLPPHVEYLLLSLYRYFTTSPKKEESLKDIQEIMNMAKKKLLQSSTTNWLALSQCIDRVLKHWNVLYTYFAVQMYTVADALFPAMTLEEGIFNRMNYPLTKAYLEFLNYVLRLSANFNALFQTNDIIVHSFYVECTKFLTLVASNFMQPEVIQRNDLCTIDPYNGEYLLPSNKINVGQGARRTLCEFTSSMEEGKQGKITAFYNNCLQYYQELFQQTVKRLPFQNNFIRDLSFLIPENALQKNKNLSQLDSIFEKFKTKILEMDTTKEWCELGRLIEQNEVDDLSKLKPVQFWSKIQSMKSSNNKNMFPNISKLANMCLCLPHSNAEMERFFLMVREVQTLDRNRLKPDTIAAITRIKLHLRDTKKTSMDYPVTVDMLKLFNSKMYNRKVISANISDVIVEDEADDNESADTDTE